ncbi:DUF4199 family protein [Flavobacterium sp. NST-5]|uniref:DUF4199 family protein n=1 Tax=Flavobacterium ichthyis TaxID=2698827 RepID=A0ABW9Z554_9FLAO|nr:DUF4199 domain-containing protein [Flavobacterium ichthyis]NBL63819.1 DUF4199 family protein [Flavobacterium ichthyis]
MKKYAIEIKWSMIFMGVSLLWLLIERLVGLHDQYIHLHPYLTMLFIIPAIWMYVLALKDKKNYCYGGQMTFVQGFLTGMIITLILTAVSPLTQYVVSEYLTPNFFDNAITYSLKTGYHKTEAEAKAYFSYENYALQSTISAFIWGLLTSLVVAFFVKTKKNLI